MDTEKHSVLTKRIARSVFALNFMHSSRLHTLAALRTLVGLFIYVSSAFWFLGLQHDIVALNIALLILSTGLVGMAIAAFKAVAIPCECGQVSVKRSSLVISSRSLDSTKRLGVLFFWFWSLVLVPLLVLAGLMCAALMHRELIPATYSVLRCFCLYAGIFCSTAGAIFFTVTFTSPFRRLLVNVRSLGEFDFGPQSLQGRSSDELNELIACAMTLGHLDLAEAISQRLMLLAEAPE